MQCKEHEISQKHNQALAYCVENNEVTSLVMKQSDNFGNKKFIINSTQLQKIE